MASDIDKFLDGLAEKYGDEYVQLHNKEVEVISTGSFSLDVCTGVGGIPRGRFSCIEGPKSVGKTTICLNISKSVIDDGGRVLFVDAENTLTFNYVRSIIPSADESNFVIVNPPSLNKAMDTVISGIESGLFDVVFFDSLPALPSEEELEKGMDKDVMMVLPRLTNKFLKLSAHKVRSNRTAVVIINQVRADTKSFVGGYTNPGGEALNHFLSLLISLRAGKAIEDGDERIGVYANYTVKKNKMGVPFKSHQFPMIYGKGIDHTRDVLEFATMLGVVTRRGSYFYYGDTNLGQGMNNATNHLEENPEVLEEIKQACITPV